MILLSCVIEEEDNLNIFRGSTSRTKNLGVSENWQDVVKCN